MDEKNQFVARALDELNDRGITAVEYIGSRINFLAHNFKENRREYVEVVLTKSSVVMSIKPLEFRPMERPGFVDYGSLDVAPSEMFAAYSSHEQSDIRDSFHSRITRNRSGGFDYLSLSIEFSEQMNSDAKTKMVEGLQKEFSENGFSEPWFESSNGIYTKMIFRARLSFIDYFEHADQIAALKEEIHFAVETFHAGPLFVSLAPE